MMKYFVLQLKRVLRILPYVLAASAALLLCLFAAFDFAAKSSVQEDMVRFKLAIVGSADDGYLMTGLEIVQSYDSARLAVDTVQMNELEAIRALEAGEIGAYVVIPEGYIRDAMGGNVGALKYVSTTGAADLTALFKDEVTAVVSDIIIACEKSMYGVEDALALKGLENRSNSYIYDISLTYVDYILDREDFYSVRELGLHDTLGLDGYLFSGILVVIISLLMTPICAVAIKEEYSFERVLKSKGIGAFGQVTGEFGAIFAVYAFLFLAISIATSLLGASIPGLARYTSVFMLGRIHVILSVVFTLSAMTYLLVSLAKNMVSGVLINFAFSLICCFAAGCMYPLSFFPDSMQHFAKVLPQYYCTEAVASAITKGSSSALIALVFYGLAMLSVSVLVRDRRLKRGQG